MVAGINLEVSRLTMIEQRNGARGKEIMLRQQAPQTK
jgi:hypothetical protein